jgi:hypothetical protein
MPMGEAPRPETKLFNELAARELIPYILGEKALAGDRLGGDGYVEQYLAAFEWFLYRTQDRLDLRAELADAIVSAFRGCDDVHDYLHLAEDVMGPLGAHRQIVEMLHFRTDLVCCVYQGLLDGLAACAALEDVPALIDLVSAETTEETGAWGGSGPVMRRFLGDLLGVGGWEGMDEGAWKEWWASPPRDGPDGLLSRGEIIEKAVGQGLGNIRAAAYHPRGRLTVTEPDGARRDISRADVWLISCAAGRERPYIAVLDARTGEPVRVGGCVAAVRGTDAGGGR